MPRPELLDRERLGDEVVRAQLAPERAVLSPLGCATDDDRHRGFCPEVGAEDQPMVVWEHEVENDGVGPDLVEGVIPDVPHDITHHGGWD